MQSFKDDDQLAQELKTSTHSGNTRLELALQNWLCVHNIIVLNINTTTCEYLRKAIIIVLNINTTTCEYLRKAIIIVLNINTTTCEYLRKAIIIVLNINATTCEYLYKALGTRSKAKSFYWFYFCTCCLKLFWKIFQIISGMKRCWYEQIRCRTCVSESCDIICWNIA